jgi:DNA ligase-1
MSVRNELSTDVEQLLSIITKLQSESSKLGMQIIIGNNLDKEYFAQTMQFLLNPYIVTGLSMKKINKTIYTGGNENINTITELMDYLTINNTGRDYDIATCYRFMEKLDDYELKDFVIKLVTKTLKVGVDSLWNKTVPSVFRVPEFNVMLAKSYDDYKDKVKGNFTITKKLDGNRVIIIKENNQSRAFTRTGKEYEGLEDILDVFDNVIEDNTVWDGELLADTQGDTQEVFSETQSLARSKGKHKKGLVFHCFDMLPLSEFQQGKSKLNAVARKKELHEWFKSVYDSFDSDDSNIRELIKEVEVLYSGKDQSMITHWADYATDNGWEGCMINLDSPYVTKRSDSLLKAKRFHTVDLEIIGFEEGTNKYEGMLGALIVDYKGNSVGVGSGYSDAQRKEFWDNRNSLLGRVIEISYFEVSKDSKTNIESLRFPVFKGIREDGKKVSYN